MTRLLVLRPRPGADITLDKLRSLGLEGVAVPLFEVQPVAWEPPDPANFDGLLLTSANAVRLGGEPLRSFLGLKVYAVGEATAEAARDAGFDIAAIGNAGVDSLLGSTEPGLKLLHLCGEDRRDPDGTVQEIVRVTVYHARALEAPDLPALEGTVALIHSPRAGKRFGELAGDRSIISIAAISDAAAAAVGSGWRTVEIADQPTDDALLALASTLCDKPDPK